MHAQRNHACKNPERRCDMGQATLDGPRTKSFHVDALYDTDGPVLMPAQRPVCSYVLVEKNCANGTALRAERSGGYCPDCSTGGERRLEFGKVTQSDTRLIRRY
jgi:hypothetical protein